MIYFIRDVDGDFAKIGFSSNPWRRIESIRTASPRPLVIEAVIEGDKALEASLHALFSDQRQHGEWFIWAGPVAEYVATLATISRPAGKRDPLKSEIGRVIVDLGFAKSYASHLNSGQRKWPLGLAVAVWKRTGQRVGPLARASESDLIALGSMVERGTLKVRRAA